MINNDFLVPPQEVVDYFIDVAKEKEPELSNKDADLLHAIINAEKKYRENEYSFHIHGKIRSLSKADHLTGIGQAIFKELRAALCDNDPKYKQDTDEIKSNFKLLIGAIGGYVAAQIGVEVVVVSALTAVLLKFSLTIGVNAFCKHWQGGENTPDE